VFSLARCLKYTRHHTNLVWSHISMTGYYIGLQHYSVVNRSRVCSLQLHDGGTLRTSCSYRLHRNGSSNHCSGQHFREQPSLSPSPTRQQYVILCLKIGCDPGGLSRTSVLGKTLLLNKVQGLGALTLVTIKNPIFWGMTP
jgi:hypothetical protein